MKRTIQILLIFFTAFLGLMLHSEHVSAAELSHTNFVDSLKFSTTKLTQGQTTSVRVEFSSKDNLKVKAGDTITFTLPAELQGMTENDGSPRKISLGELGEALIYKDRVIATFNEKVNQLEHVKGYFNFGLQATRTKNPNDTSIKTNLSTTATAQEITIHGDPGNTGEIGTLPFFWKSGDMLGEKGKVRWFVNANMTKEELSSDIILTDTHGLGQKLDAQSFRVSIENYLGNFQITGDEFVAKGYGSIQILPDDSFIITIKREHARLASFSFMYNTIITDNTVKSFTNTCNVNYQPYGQETVQDQGTSDVINLFADGDANGEQGLKEATEETLENNFEELEEMPAVEAEKPNSSVTENEANQTAEKHQVEIHVAPNQEVVEDESEQLEEIPAVETEKPNSSVTENEANQTAEKHQVEVNVAPNQEVVEDESEQLEEIPAVEAEKPNSSVTENEANQTAEKHQVEIHVAPNQEVVEDESEQLEEIPAVETEKPNSSVTENEANQTAEKHQVDIHVAPNQEVITDESKKVKDVQHPQFEKAKPVVSEKKKSEKADVQTLGTKTNTSKSSTVTHSEKVEKQSGNTLPKTGEDKGFISVFTGFFLLFLSFVAFSLRRDRQA
ncbi:collagen binding domain-containing protein [Lactococcus garvieae]|uniref:collagen binding domain-containing protein n=2 Tax=Lactococcus garvieae TaxID=1363 RepID=UPI00254EBD33|nr:collagen binding domain-containing protein [Lactococcus garvieae]